MPLSRHISVTIETTQTEAERHFVNVSFLGFKFPSFQNLVVWAKNSLTETRVLLLTFEKNYTPIWALGPMILTLCICHAPLEDPQPSPSSRRHQQAAGFLKKGVFSYHLCLIAANKTKAYILKIVPGDSISLIYLGFLLFFMEKRIGPLNEEDRDEIKYTEPALRNYTIQRERSITGRLKGILAYFTLLHAWTENLLPSHPLLFPASDNHAAEWQGFSSDPHFCAQGCDTQLLQTRVEVRKNLDW